MEYVRCECEACKQMILLPGEVREPECLCPGCGKPVSIPEHLSPPFVHRMRGRLLVTVTIAFLLWLAWTIFRH